MFKPYLSISVRRGLGWIDPDLILYKFMMKLFHTNPPQSNLIWNNCIGHVTSWDYWATMWFPELGSFYSLCPYRVVWCKFGDVYGIRVSIWFGRLVTTFAHQSRQWHFKTRKRGKSHYEFVFGMTLVVFLTWCSCRRVDPYLWRCLWNSGFYLVWTFGDNFCPSESTMALQNEKTREISL
jgi:hypothetical protein